MRLAVGAVCLVAAAGFRLHGQASSSVSYERLSAAATEPQNWLTYSGTYFSQRHSLLDQINLSNVKNLEQKWMYQASALGAWQATPLVVDGIMYVSQRPNDVVALDAKTGRAFWIYRHVPAPGYDGCCGTNNRGLAILGDSLFIATPDARLVAMHTRTGRLLWDVPVADFKPLTR